MKIGHLTKLEQKAVETFVSGINEALKSDIVEVRLFGSRARKGGDENSDLDILVLLKECNTKAKHVIWDMANDIFLDTWINISPLVMSKPDFKRLLAHERLIALDIKKDGIIL